MFLFVFFCFRFFFVNNNVCNCCKAFKSVSSILTCFLPFFSRIFSCQFHSSIPRFFRYPDQAPNFRSSSNPIINANCRKRWLFFVIFISLYNLRHEVFYRSKRGERRSVSICGVYLILIKRIRFMSL